MFFQKSSSEAFGKLLTEVSDLFDGTEPSIQQQLKHYKKRNLKDSYHKRVLSKSFQQTCGLNTHDFSITNLSQSKNDDKVPSSTMLDVFVSLPNVKADPLEDISINELQADSSLKDWIEKRKKFRQNINKNHLSRSWTRQKHERSHLADYILSKLRASGNNVYLTKFNDVSCFIMLFY